MAWRLRADRALLVVGGPADSGAPGARPGGAAGAGSLPALGCPRAAPRSLECSAEPRAPRLTRTDMGGGAGGPPPGRGLPPVCPAVRACAEVRPPWCVCVCLSVCALTCFSFLCACRSGVCPSAVSACRCLCSPVRSIWCPRGPFPGGPSPPRPAPHIHAAPLLHSSLPEPKLAQLSTAGEVFGSKLGAGWARGVLGTALSSGTGHQGVDQPQAPPSASRTGPPRGGGFEAGSQDSDRNVASALSQILESAV